MRKKELFVIVLLLITIVANAQINVGKIKPPTKEQAASILKDQLVKILEKSRDEYAVTDFNYAVSFSDNSGSFETEEKYRKYKRHFFDALEPEKIADKSDLEKARSYNDVGEMFYASTKYKSAERSFHEAQKLYESSGSENTAEYCKLLSNLGLLYHTTGQYTRAKYYSENAYNKRSNIGDNTGLAASLNNLAVLHKDMGNYNEAETLIHKAVQEALKNDGEKSSAYAIVLNNQAIIYQTTGRYSEAESVLKKAIGIASEELREKSPSYVKMKVNLALLYQLQERFDEAEAIYTEAIEIRKKRLGTRHPDYAVMLRNMASLLMLKGEYAKAEDNLNQAVAIYKRQFGEENPIYARSLNELGNYYLHQNDINKARKPLVDALAICRKTLGEHHPFHTDATESLAIMHWQDKNYSTAAALYRNVMKEYLHQIQTYFPPMSESEKTKFWEKIHPKFIRFYAFAAEAKGVEPDIAIDMYNYHIATKALLLSNSIKMRNSIMNSGDQALIKKYNEWADAREHISRLYSLSHDELAEEGHDLAALEKNANDLEKELSQISDVFSKGLLSETITQEHVQKSLESGEAVLEMIRFRGYEGIKPTNSIHYAAIVLGPGMKRPVIVTMHNGREMEGKLATAYRKAMQEGESGEEFYSHYWKPAEQLCTDFHTLYVSVDGIYNQINLNTMKLPSGNYLLNEKRLNFVGNSKDVINLKNRSGMPRSGKVVMVGDPVYSEGIPEDQIEIIPLPGTRVEVETLDDMLKKSGWKTEVFLGNRAEEEAVKQISKPYILHIATHGFFLEDVWSDTEKIFGIEPVKAANNPLLRAGLLFRNAEKTIQNYELPKGREDGILNAMEAMLLDLEGTELVVLSACETGLGEIMNGEGVYGLQRAFQVAGSNAVLISLWQVSDEGTMQLMTGFYKHWLSGKSKQEAFRLAQEELKAVHPQPFYWGSFILMSK